tara:strand:- start:1308 stop:1580 length:273 start_codon:yes stop_codon:yes gene_type:complete
MAHTDIPRDESVKLKLPEEFDRAVVGVSQRIGMEDCIVYDVNEVLLILMQDMSEEDALEHFNYNMAGSYVGETTPIFLWPRTMKEIEDDE